MSCPPTNPDFGQYLDLGASCLWYADRGTGDPLVLLHGGAVDSRWWNPNIDALTERFHVYTTDMRGHGRTPDVEGPFSFDLFAQDVIGFLEAVVGRPARLVGHSVGAFTALLVALRRPELVSRLALISAGFHHRGNVQQGGFDVDGTVEFIGPSYGEVSPDGQDHFRVVVEKLSALATSNQPALEPSDLAAVRTRTLVMVADDDLVTLDHAVEMSTALPNAELAVVPGTSHFLTQEKPALVNALLVDFLANDPVPLVAPIRRAQEQPASSS